MGNPEFIKECSYEEIVEFYNDNYSPSKAKLYFYGDLDIEEIFSYIEENYLGKIKTDENNSLVEEKFELGKNNLKETIYEDEYL